MWLVTSLYGEVPRGCGEVPRGCGEVPRGCGEVPRRYTYMSVFLFTQLSWQCIVVQIEPESFFLTFKTF